MTSLIWTKHDKTNQIKFLSFWLQLCSEFITDQRSFKTLTVQFLVISIVWILNWSSIFQNTTGSVHLECNGVRLDLVLLTTIKLSKPLSVIYRPCSENCLFSFHDPYIKHHMSILDVGTCLFFVVPGACDFVTICDAGVFASF